MTTMADYSAGYARSPDAALVRSAEVLTATAGSKSILTDPSGPVARAAKARGELRTPGSGALRL